MNGLNGAENILSVCKWKKDELLSLNSDDWKYAAINYSMIMNVFDLNWNFAETPETATEKIFFETDDVHRKAPQEIRINWNAYNLTTNLNANIMISLWGYRESTI